MMHGLPFSSITMSQERIQETDAENGQGYGGGSPQPPEAKRVWGGATAGVQGAESPVEGKCVAST